MPVPSGQEVAAVYLTIKNDSSVPDVLVSESSADASTVVLQLAVANGTSGSFVDTASVTIDAGKSLVFAPDGYHLAVRNLLRPLHLGDNTTITLTFKRASAVTVRVPVVTAAAAVNEKKSLPSPPPG